MALLSELLQALAQSAVLVLVVVPLNIVVVLLQLVTSGFGLCGGKRRPAPKSILLTGATSGIGEALALEYAGPGVHLALTGRNAVALTTVQAACVAKGATVLTLIADVTDAAKLKAFVDRADAAAPLDLVIANAGVTENTAGKTDDIEGAARALFATNIDGLFNTIFPALVHMRARGRGQVALLASLASWNGLPGSGAYSATKAAVRMYGEALRAQLAREGVAVNVVNPGYVKSPMTDANPFPQPFKISMATAVAAIVRGLSYNVAQISFPAPTLLAVYALGALPYAVKDWLAAARVIPQIAYWRKRKAGKEGVAAKAADGLAASLAAPLAADAASEASAPRSSGSRGGARRR
jgi:short-subunit dehydrogenase